MKFFAFRSLALIGSLVIAGSAHANLLINGSFEDGTFTPNSQNTQTESVGSTNITGFTVIGGPLTRSGSTNPFGLTASNGDKFLDLTGYQDSPPYGGVTQSIATMIGALYQLSFDLGSSDRYGRPVSILASAGSTSATFTNSLLASGAIFYERETLNFTATSSSTTVSLLGTQGNQFIGLDNADVTLIRAAGPITTPVPEPGTFALVLASLGLAGIATRRRQG